MQKTTVSIVVTLILLLFCINSFSQVKAQQNNTIYIRQDGNIEPLTAPIQREGNNYFLTNDIQGQIIIQKDNLLIDGKGFTLQGTGNGTGIDLLNCWNITIQNFKINHYAIGINHGSNCNIKSNYIENNGEGLRFIDSTEITNNTVTNNDYGIGLHIGSNNNLISGNKISANNWAGIAIDMSSGNVISGNDITRNVGSGIILRNAYNNTVCKNNITQNGFNGISVTYSNKNMIVHNYFKNQVQAEVTEISQPQYASMQYNSANSWDNGKEGNYWSDYKGSDGNSDGIGDNYYLINENNADRFPLMQLTLIPEFPQPYTLGAILILVFIAVAAVKNTPR